MKLYVHGLPKENQDDHLKLLQGLGCDALVIGFGQTETAQKAKDLGVDVFACSGVFSHKHFNDDQLLAIDIEGNPQLWFNSDCPNQSRVRDKHLDEVYQNGTHPELNGIFLDGIRFASMASGLMPFLTCFCEVCHWKSAEMGYDMSRIKSGVRGLRSVMEHGMERWPRGLMELLSLPMDWGGVLQWIEFRRDCILEHIRNVYDTLKQADNSKQLCAYTFVPSFAPLVGQDYRSWADVVDIFSPMTYRWGDGPSCLTAELALMTQELHEKHQFDEAAVCALLFNLCGYDVEPPKALAELGESVPPRVMGIETERARAMIGDKAELIPIIRIHDDRKEECVKQVLDAGADGISLFNFKDESNVEDLKLAAKLVKG